MITPYNILRHELTGLQMEVVEATHPGYKCLGIIVAETKNTIKVKTQDGVKTVPKQCVTFDVRLPGGEMVRIDGRLMTARPEDRIKRKHRIRF